MHLPLGKVPVEILKGIVFKNLGFKREEVALGPSVGFDGAVVNVGDKSIITSMDPITGAVERVGWLAVNVNANDVATFGVQPFYFSSCILLPEGADEKIVEDICRQMDRASKDLKISIIGGHCEVTPGLKNPIVIGCAMGISARGNYVTAGGAKPGDKLILTKEAGIEGTAILATERFTQLSKMGLNMKLLKSAQNFFERISVVKEGVLAFKTGWVDAMHDPTEGGILGGINEMVDASNLGVKVFLDKIPVAIETRKICSFFQIDPLRLISSGALLIASKPESTDKIIKCLEAQGVKANVIGEFLEEADKRLMVREDGGEEVLPRPEYDHLWIALEK